jgi:myo-inositol-1(or 4)-monophosphatase
LAEGVILNELSRVFPDHRIHSEEAGDNGLESDWLWMIDPLDGTNNFAIGFPVFSVSITLLYKREPVLGVIYEPMVNRLFISRLNGGFICNNKILKIKKNKNMNRLTIGWIQGHAVQNDEKAVRLRHYIDGIILYNSEGDDLYSGILMVKEAGGIVVDFQGNEFTGMSSEPYLIACHPDHKHHFMQMVKEGLHLS